MLVKVTLNDHFNHVALRTAKTPGVLAVLSATGLNDRYLAIMSAIGLNVH